MDLLQIAAALDGLPLHSLLILALVILWRDNRTLRDKIDGLHEKSEGIRKDIQQQNFQMGRIEAQTEKSAKQLPYSPKRP